MKLEELRIGNWVEEISEDGNAIFEIDILDVNEPLETIFPIPLTPEWLERCSIKVEDWEGIHSITREKVSGTSWYHDDIDGDLNDKCYYELEHVHQLQNFFYALTGNELELK